jgi:predicted HAD superfamily Cof-like phosphohydrolase
MTHIMKTLSREDKVKKFHKAMGTDVASQPRVSLFQLREKLLMEECNEVCQELNKMEMATTQGRPISREQWAALLKELADLQYVLSGTIVSFKPIAGSFTPAFNRVHNSNMSKLDDEGKPVLNSYGKVTKGPNYKAPTLEDLIQ